MDSRIGLDLIVEDEEYTTKLGSALDTTNVQIKKQVFELLSALCVYSSEGYNRALEALEHYKSFRSERYRFKLIVDELREAKKSEYQTVLLAFVNCLIISTPQLKDRNRVRNEFIGLKLLDVLKSLRGRHKGGDDLTVQLDVFEEQKESDEVHVQGPHGVDLNSHLDLFYAILKNVMDTPQEIPFLSILQHLVKIDPKEAVSDLIWDTAERLTHRATLLETKDDCQRLLRAPSQHKSLHRLKSMDNGLRKQSAADPSSAPIPPPPPPPPNGAPAPPPPPPPPPGGAPAPPPPPPPPGGAPPPPPPPPPPGGAPPPPPPPPGCGPPPPPPPPGAPAPPPPPGAPAPPGAPRAPTAPATPTVLPGFETPKPKSKMRTFNWNKLPVNKIWGKKNIWSLVSKKNEKSPNKAKIDFNDMESLFCQQAPVEKQEKASGSTVGGKVEDDQRNKKQKDEVNLLDGKRSLNINIFLRQFRSCNEDIIQMILDGDHDDFGAEKLKGLMKIMPEMDEIEMLKSFDGDKTKLGNAEKFVLALVEVPNYKLRAESMLLKAEFEANVSFLEPSIDAMIQGSEDLMSSQKLQDLFYMVLMAGNFLNSGGYAGNAAGMKISSLHKLADIRSNKPGLTMLHYVAAQAEKTNSDLLTLPDDLAILEEAGKTPVDQLSLEVTQLDNQIKKIQTQMSAPNIQADVKNQSREFLQYASKEVELMKEHMASLKKLQVDLAEFFCEDSKTFKMEECFDSLAKFCKKFKEATSENAKRKEQEALAEQRRILREQEEAKKAKNGVTSNGTQQPTSNGQNKEDSEEGQVMNNLMSDIQNGFVHRRLPDGGFKQAYSPMVMRKFKKSLDNSEDNPEIGLNSPRLSRKNRGGSFSGSGPSLQELNGDMVNSPGGTRRRRSRIPSEEDDQLLNFLVTGSQDKEKNLSVGNLVAESQQNYGSLDRGLMRRSRGRRRPEMLNIDQDRDRSAPTLPPPAPTIVEKPTSEVPDKSGKIKNRLNTWLKDAEDDAEKAQLYLDKKREIKGKKSSVTDIVPPTDIIKAMEVVEDHNLANPRKKTPPGPGGEDRKKLIRELGRKPSEEKVSLYVRKASEENEQEENKAKKFLDSMARKSLEVPADFLDTIKEEKNEIRPSTRQQIAKKYPFNRTTTPNSLREHLKETLTKNLGGSAHDIAETIEHFKNDEILDTFNIDNENVESPTTQRKTRQQQQRRDTDQDSENGDFGSRRRNLKFRTLGSSDKPLGDREMLLKKKRASTSDLSGGANGADPDSEDIGNGLFDRFSAARKTLTRGSTRRKKDDEDTKSLNEVNLEKKSSVSDWRSRLASKFKKSSTDQYEVKENGQENGEPSLSSYRKTSHELDAPMTEPTRRRTLGSMQNSGRKISQNGEYDSEMVDGKYVTSVPILNPEGEEEEEGNVRPRHRDPPKGLKDLKPVKNPREDLIERLSRPTGSTTDRKTVSQSNVFDRLSGTRGSIKKSVQDNRHHNPGSGTTLTKIKDLTKNLRKNSKDEEDTNDHHHHSESSSSQSNKAGKSFIAPKNSLTMFNDRSRPSGTLNGTLNGSKNSIHSSTKSLQQKDSPRSVRRATTSTLDNNRSISSTRTTPARHIGSSTTNLRNANSKEDLSRSSSSASNSQQDLTKNIMKSTYSTPNIRSSPMRITSSATLTPASPSKARRTTPSSASSSTSSFMKPTASSAKKLSSNIGGSTSLSSGTSQPKRTTTSTVTRLTATRPSRR